MQIGLAVRPFREAGQFGQKADKRKCSVGTTAL